MMLHIKSMKYYIDFKIIEEKFLMHRKMCITCYAKKADYKQLVQYVPIVKNLYT